MAHDGHTLTPLSTPRSPSRQKSKIAVVRPFRTFSETLKLTLTLPRVILLVVNIGCYFLIFTGRVRDGYSPSLHGAAVEAAFAINPHRAGVEVGLIKPSSFEGTQERWKHEEIPATHPALG